MKEHRGVGGVVSRKRNANGQVGSKEVLCFMTSGD